MAVSKLHNYLLVAGLLLKALDNITTTIAVSATGPAAELNPLVRWTIERIGLEATMLLNFGLFAAMMVLLRRKKGTRSMVFVVALLGCVVASNIAQLLGVI